MVDSSNNDLFDREDDDYDTYIAPDLKFSGNIRFEKPFIVKGQISGNIEASSDLVVDSGAVINADISADRILVRGKITGNVKGKRVVFVTSTGSVSGDITSAQVVLEAGSDFTGRCTMIK
ncbi:bactofilin family protein [Treponema parvum]|uniref:bactofilin family protein n=1 Tax=Treponema parvum TaxID=138851 RepID=UPI001AEBB29B|nr:polymer-forming cytoskeletal protein [Treponema parvum]QTQ15887.1 polymer-forming cytoskeletal protein [Treponema parvum]